MWDFLSQLDFVFFTASIGFILGLSFRAGKPDLNWTQAVLCWLYPALLLAVGGALAIYPFKFDAYETGRFVGASVVYALFTLRFCSSTLLSRIGLGDVTAKEKPRIVLAGGLIAVMLLMIFNVTSSIPFASKTAQWVPTSESTGASSRGDIFYLDAANVIVDGNRRIAWHRHEHRRYDTGVASTVIKWQLDCAARKARALDSASFFSFDDEGEVLRRVRRDTEWEAVQAGSNLGALHQVVCLGTY
jgi:hypothetical protein